MADEKVYTPQVLQDAPFPTEVIQSDVISTGSKEVATPATIQDTKFPHIKSAKELLSNSLNTKSKKILQEFTFAQHGAIKVGKYENGVSGEVNISPDGISARNQDNLDTFVLDGQTGDASFAGQVTILGGVITGEVLVGNTNDDSFVLIDGANNRILINDGTSNRIVIGNVV